ncbi:hypothetical protein EON82_09550 [bacterium]|nr:MAG: hypothetical protein EON82_09550 [bacterium]
MIEFKTKAKPKPAPSSLPEVARRYLDHAIACGTPPAKTVKLCMRGEIKLRGWAHFEATETIEKDRRMIWKAKTKLLGLPIKGFDKVELGYGHCEWKLFGLLPIVSARGKDVSRSAVGRMAAESIWLPSVLLGDNVRWIDAGQDHARFAIELFGHETEVTLGLSPNGRIETISFMRWGNPNGEPFGFYPFGGYVDEETTFEGFTIPTRLRLGWHFGTGRFETDGEFFRATVDAAEFA